MKIKHLVISGGGPIMVQSIAAIQQLEKHKVIIPDEIETIYGTSAGAIVGIIMCLKFDWNTINDYIIKRPWHEIFQIKAQNIFEAYSKKGIFDITLVKKCFKPLFDAKDINLDITLQDFYDLTKIELHMFTFEINKYELQDVSYLTHPTLSLMMAVQMTCGLPILMTPVCLDGQCFIDGGISCNYPLNHCVLSGKQLDEILGLKNKYSTDKTTTVNEETNLLDFLLGFLLKAIFSINTNNLQPTIKYEVLCDAHPLSIDKLNSALSNIEIRKEYFENGTKCADIFISSLDLEDGI